MRLHSNGWGNILWWLLTWAVLSALWNGYILLVVRINRAYELWGVEEVFGAIALVIRFGDWSYIVGDTIIGVGLFGILCRPSGHPMVRPSLCLLWGTIGAIIVMLFTAVYVLGRFLPCTAP